MATRLEIVNGPSKFNLMVCLFRDESIPEVQVWFHYYGGKDCSGVVIDSLEREGGSGESWNLKGYICSGYGRGNVTGHFRTDTRKGFLVLGEELPPAP